MNMGSWPDLCFNPMSGGNGFNRIFLFGLATMMYKIIRKQIVAPEDLVICIEDTLCTGT